MLCLRRRSLLSDPGTVVTEITLNHEFLMSSYNTASERALATIAVDMHGGTDLDVLVGGLGLGYTTRAVLDSPRVAKVTVVEFLPQVIEWMSAGLVPLSESLMGEERLTVRRGDVYAELAAPPRHRHDLVIIDVDHAPDENLHDQNTTFYTAAGLRGAAAHLAEEGVLAVWSYAESSPFADALRTVFTEVRVEPITIWNKLVNEEHTDWLFFARRPRD